MNKCTAVEKASILDQAKDCEISWNVYRMNDYEWYASQLSIEETNEIYKKVTGVSEEENPVEDITVSDIKKGIMYISVDSVPADETPLDFDTHMKSLKFDDNGSLIDPPIGKYIKDSHETWICVTFEQAINQLWDKKSEAFLLTSIEW